MKAILKISKHTSGLVEEHLITKRYHISFNNYRDTIWKGKKRFAF